MYRRMYTYASCTQTKSGTVIWNLRRTLHDTYLPTALPSIPRPAPYCPPPVRRAGIAALLDSMRVLDCGRTAELPAILSKLVKSIPPRAEARRRYGLRRWTSMHQQHLVSMHEDGEDVSAGSAMESSLNPQEIRIVIEAVKRCCGKLDIIGFSYVMFNLVRVVGVDLEHHDDLVELAQQWLNIAVVDLPLRMKKAKSSEELESLTNVISRAMRGLTNMPSEVVQSIARPAIGTPNARLTDHLIKLVPYCDSRSLSNYACSLHRLGLEGSDWKAAIARQALLIAHEFEPAHITATTPVLLDCRPVLDRFATVIMIRIREFETAGLARTIQLMANVGCTYADLFATVGFAIASRDLDGERSAVLAEIAWSFAHARLNVVPLFSRLERIFIRRSARMTPSHLVKTMVSFSHLGIYSWRFSFAGIEVRICTCEDVVVFTCSQQLRQLSSDTLKTQSIVNALWSVLSVCDSYVGMKNMLRPLWQLLEDHPPSELKRDDRYIRLMASRIYDMYELWRSCVDPTEAGSFPRLRPWIDIGRDVVHQRESQLTVQQLAGPHLAAIDVHLATGKLEMQLCPRSLYRIFRVRDRIERTTIDAPSHLVSWVQIDMDIFQWPTGSQICRRKLLEAAGWTFVTLDDL